ncbi:hypothetical protein DL96DRAFT_1607099 [Flagelloscypha sp. PMI_526]|nr:hypothetical protein DL96DRAFT_1607099 [Flagelloscypha sp. PMI_526]
MGILPRLEYSITRPYPWAWYSETVTFLSVSFLVIVTLVNVAATGYEPITFISTNFNETQKFWWSAFDPNRNDPLCDSKNVMIGDTFQTVNSAFQYSVQQTSRSIPNTSYVQGTSGQPAYLINTPGISYSGRSLTTDCLNGYGSPLMNLVADLSQRSVEARASFGCSEPYEFVQERGFSQSFNLVTVFKMKQFALPAAENQIYTGVDQKTNAAFTLNAVLDDLASDILVALLGQDSNSPTSVTLVEAFSRTWCPELGAWDGSMFSTGSSSELQNCRSQKGRLGSPSQTILLKNGSTASSSSAPSSPPPDPNLLPKALNQSVENFFLAFAAATTGDLGRWDPGSIFVGNNMLNQTLSSSPDVTAIIANTSSSSVFTNLVGQNQTTSNVAVILARNGVGSGQPNGVGAIPLLASQQQPDTTITTLYTCHGRKRKSPLNLIISVIVADLSMFGAFWGTLTLVSAILAKRRGDVTANACGAYTHDSHSYSLQQRGSEEDTVGGGSGGGHYRKANSSL